MKILIIYPNMNLQENISRIKQMMGLLTEVTNPYKVEWELKVKK